MTDRGGGSDGRFTPGVGAGERLTEHVMGGQHFPSVRGRHERFGGALEIIRLPWQGGYRSYEGEHLQLEDARVFDLPETCPSSPSPPAGRPAPGCRWAPDAETAAQAVWEKSRWALTGWKVMSELPNPVNFDAATQSVTLEQIQQQFACGPDLARHLEVAQQFVDAGFDHIVAQNAGPDPDGFLDFFQRELAEPLRALTPTGDAPAPGLADKVLGVVRG